MKKAIFLLTLALTPSRLWAQDSRDEDIFGSASAPNKATDDKAASDKAPTEKTPPAAAPQAVAPTHPASSNQLIDSLQIGGRLEIRANSAQAEQQKLPESSYSQLKRADIYFDTRPNKDLRALMRLRISEQHPIKPALAATTPPGPKTELDEMWFKWNLADSVFFTLGKQHLKWGSGRIWNPTDFTSTAVRDPLALFDSRLGQELLKIHFPIEKQGFNYYGILQFNDMNQNDDLGVALRGEFAFGGIGEGALSFQTKKNGPVRVGADISCGLGPIDVYTEAALSQHQKQSFYEGEIDAATATLPTPKSRDSDTFTQVVGGVEYSLKYSADDSITFGAEYFDNSLGYENRELELYSLFTNQSSPLYAGKKYTGAFARLPTPGSWNETSFFLNAMGNLSDNTTVARLTGTWQVYKEATFEAFVSQCFGDYGELCFRIPGSIQALAANPSLPPELRSTIAALPSSRTKSTAGVAMSMSF